MKVFLNRLTSQLSLGVKLGLLFSVLTVSPSAFSGWEMTFQEEFDQGTLDRTKWKTSDYWGNQTLSGNNEGQCYVDDAFSFADGKLKITAKEQATNMADCFGAKKDLTYTSGMITTAGCNKWESGPECDTLKRFTQQYGYFEMRAKFPAGKGFWPAFWLKPIGGWPPEIDVVEWLGHEVNRMHATVHYPKEGGGYGGNIHGEFTGPDFSADFHTFGVDWKQGLIIFYVDGQEIHRVDSHVPDTPVYILANLAVGGYWPGYPNANTNFPSTMDIDYIRAYKRVSDGSSDYYPPGSVNNDTPLEFSFTDNNETTPIIAKGESVEFDIDIAVTIDQTNLHAGLHVYDSQDNLIDKFFFNNVNISADQAKNIVYNYTETSNLANGEYRVALGLWSSSWSTMHKWENAVTRFTVGEPVDDEPGDDDPIVDEPGDDDPVVEDPPVDYATSMTEYVGSLGITDGLIKWSILKDNLLISDAAQDGLNSLNSSAKNEFFQKMTNPDFESQCIMFLRSSETGASQTIYSRSFTSYFKRYLVNENLVSTITSAQFTVSNDKVEKLEVYFDQKTNTVNDFMIVKCRDLTVDASLSEDDDPIVDEPGDDDPVVEDPPVDYAASMSEYVGTLGITDGLIKWSILKDNLLISDAAQDGLNSLNSSAKNEFFQKMTNPDFESQCIMFLRSSETGASQTIYSRSFTSYFKRYLVNENLVSTITSAQFTVSNDKVAKLEVYFDQKTNTVNDFMIVKCRELEAEAVLE